MPHDEGLAQRIRELLEECHDVSEKRMFGGVAFLVAGKMCVGVVRDDLMVRVGPDQYAAALRRPHARPMDFTGRPMKGFVFIAPDGVASDHALRTWVECGLRFVCSLRGGHSQEPVRDRQQRGAPRR
jgi:TfoX/Sxy family transcriptional regulator of competence genes